MMKGYSFYIARHYRMTESGQWGLRVVGFPMLHIGKGGIKWQSRLWRPLHLVPSVRSAHNPTGKGITALSVAWRLPTNAVRCAPVNERSGVHPPPLAKVLTNGKIMNNYVLSCILASP